MGILWTIWKEVQDTQSERDARGGAKSAQERRDCGEGGSAARPLTPRI